MFLLEKRTNNFTVSTGRDFKSKFDPTGFQECASDVFNTGEIKTLQCHSKVIGKYVKIQNLEKGILKLCEVQIHGILKSGKNNICDIKHLKNTKNRINCMFKILKLKKEVWFRLFKVFFSFFSFSKISLLFVLS